MNDDWKKKPPSSSGGGYRPLHDRESEKPVKREETTRERAERQRRERRAELTSTESDEERWARNRERVLAERGELGKRDTSHINFFLKAKKTEVPKFDLDEVLVNPELDAIKPTHIDPASMLADDIESLAKEGREFVKNPTLAGAASMAVVAIPGKFADDIGDTIAHVGKYKGKDVILENVLLKEIDYVKRTREDAQVLRKQFNNGVRKTFLKELATDKDVIKQLNDLGVPVSEINKLKDGMVPSQFEVHHKLPLDDSGTNDFTNLVLIRKQPDHVAFSNYQREHTRGLKVGDSQKVEWVIPVGKVYPKNKI